MKKLGISCETIVKKYGYGKAFEVCKESGFDAVDFDLNRFGKGDEFDIYHASEDQFEEHFVKIKDKAKSLELEISQTHGRCRTYTPDENKCAYARWVSEKDLRATRLLGAPSCVIHSIKSGDWPENYLDGEFMHRKNKEFFDYLIPIAEKNHVSFALETFGRAKVYGESKVDFFADANELKRQFDLLDTKNKTICMDTGHTNEAVPFGTPNPAEAIRILGKRVTLLHLHDNNSFRDQHLPPIMQGYGTIKWGEVFEALDEIGYEGVYNFELKLERYGAVLPDAIHFLGKWLRYFVDSKGVLK